MRFVVVMGSLRSVVTRALKRQNEDQHFDFIITVCDEAKETLPAWPGQPIVAHWHSPDPLRFRGTPEQVRHFFFEVAAQIAHRVDLFCSLPDPKLDALEVQLIGEKCKI